MSKIKVNSIEAATGSTITIPSGQTLDISSTTLTLPSTVVTTTGTQTLTNKTIGVSQLSGTLPVANGGTGLTTLGSATQVLRVNSGATALEFATPAVASSDFVKLLSTSASASAAVSIDGYFTSTYDKYVLYLNGGYMSTTNRINLKVNKSGTAQTGNYDGVAEYQAVGDSRLGETDYFHLGYWSASSTRRNDATIYIFNPLNTSYSKGFIWTVGGIDGATDEVWSAGAGHHDVTTAISGVTIENQSGHTFTIDKITLYGIK
jgi:hypothetical protein